MKRSKLLLFLILAFSLGFALHWLITNLQIKPEVSLLPQQEVAGAQSTTDQFITYVDYDGRKFKPSSVTVEKGNYLAITNTGREQLMWLISDNPDLQTPRGYGEGEKLQLTLLKIGEFKVVDKLSPGVSLSVKVEENQ